MLRRGTITLVFDDGYASVKRDVVTQLNRHNIPAVFAIPLASTPNDDHPPTLPWMEWLNLKSQGHEIAAHTITHCDLTKVTPTRLEQELRQPAEQLGASTLVYPGGAHSPAVMQAARRHYRAARTVNRGFESLPPQDPMRLKTYNFTNRNFSVAKANLLASWACLSNAWLIETYHLIDDNEITYDHTVTLRDFTKHLSFIAKLPVNISTINQVISSP